MRSKAYYAILSPQRLMASVAHACADQPFPLFTALLRHAATSGLPTSDRIIIVRLAMKQVSLLACSTGNADFSIEGLPG